MFTTIKNKLLLILFVLAISFSAFGYLTVKMAGDATMAATRLMIIGQTNTQIHACMMELRGFQLFGDLKAMERYNVAFNGSNQNLDALLPILLSPSNQEKIIRLKKAFNAWHESNAQRIEIIKMYGKRVNSEQFEKEHKTKYDILMSATQKSASTFADILNKSKSSMKALKKQTSIVFQLMNSSLKAS